MSHNIRTAVQAIVDNALAGTGHTRTSPFVKDAVRLVEDGVVEQAEVSADILRRIGQEQGLPESEVENALIEAGLADAPTPEPEEGEGEGGLTDEVLLARLKKIDETLGALVSAAQRNGITF